MNRLKKILLSFVLPFFCLLISVSYAEIETDTPYYPYGFSWSSTAPTSPFSDYTFDDIYNISNSYTTNPTDETTSAFNNMCSYIDNAGYCIEWVKWDYRNGMYGPWFETIIFKKGDGELGIRKDSERYQFLFRPNSTQFEIYLVCSNPNTNKFAFRTSLTDSQLNDSKYILSVYFSNFSNDIEIEYCNTNIKNMTYTDSRCYWDGTYFYEYSGGGSEEKPTLPTNAEIAQVVQAFYDSDLYKNNTNFKDFMVVYSFVTGYYSIIGTDNHLLQEIYYDGAKPSNDDFTYPETWWRFYNYLGNVQNLFYGWDYWLYSTRKEDDTFLPIKYDGVGKLNNLFKLKFTNQSIIVYSSYEYKVYEFRPPTEEGGENQVTNTTVPGDEYTYNENLDPTDSNYSPIQNYIPINPSQSILGDVDFDEINKTFDDNKGILNIENASWLFNANNQLTNYFLGFLSLLIVFLIISRILGG